MLAFGFFVGAALWILLATIPARAVPSFARQTGLPCTACHTSFPELTPFGRRFKLGGYTLTKGDPQPLDHLSAMLETSFTRTRADQAGGAAPHFGPNNNLAVDQASVFYGGRIAGQFGAFAQVTFDGIGRTFAWDNLDLRYADKGSLFGQPMLWGITLNNNPSVQDVWNTTPAWGFPYISSGLAPTPAAATLLEGAASQRVLGLGGYIFLGDFLYAEVSGYRSLPRRTEVALGVDPAKENPLVGISPYWRLAVEQHWDAHWLEVGTFGMRGRTSPDRQHGFGADRATDIGVDAQYQYLGQPSTVTLRASWIHEHQDLSASQALGLADLSQGSLRSMRASATYAYDRTYSLTSGYFAVRGNSDTTKNGTDNGSPNSSGWIGEISYTPFAHGGPSFWPWLNARLGVQYVAYEKFDGTSRGASDKNTMFVYSWIAF
ncbi:MAG: uncharacterized protein JWM77_3357 [Rhodospirillales bacterium]|nr:uncharacterized protein [Rhodospirillales bacterium]